MSDKLNSSSDQQDQQSDLIEKAHAWFLSAEGKKAIESAIEKSDQFKQELGDLQCSDPKNLDVVVNL